MTTRLQKLLNAAKKYVASRTRTKLHWNNSVLLRGDVAEAVSSLKAESGPDLQIIGSSHLIQTLQAASLIDEYNVWTFPVVLGQGKRLFSDTVETIRTAAGPFPGIGHRRCDEHLCTGRRNPSRHLFEC
jgi:dihydrofolate reductase